MSPMTTAAKRTRRPMIEMTGTIADLRQGDYVDTLGGGKWKRVAVGAIIHKITHVEGSFNEELAWQLSGIAGVSARKADRLATRPEHATIEFLGKGTHSMHSSAPANFRRFADAEATA